MSWFAAWAQHRIDKSHVDGLALDLADPDAPALLAGGVRHPLTGDPDEAAVYGLVRVLARARRIAAHFPLADTVHAAPLADWGWATSLRAELRIGDRTAVAPVATDGVLALPTEAFEARLAAWQLACAQALTEADPDPAAFAFDPPGRDGADDPSWPAFAAALDLGPDAVRERVRASLAWSAVRYERAAAKFREVYGLRLPAGLGDFAALTDALGALPLPAPQAWSAQPPGWARGAGWLSAALRMTPAGLGDWLEDGGLQRLPALDADGAPLDPRLDWRFRRDAPPFVTFASGDSDGSHWGFWYDSPQHEPRIAHNWARDSAETDLEDQDELVALLEATVAERLEILVEERDSSTDGDYVYALDAQRAVRVVALHLEALRAAVGARPLDLCPWPRVPGPVGSPTLAEPPGHHVRPADLAGARAALAEGDAGPALFLGLRLHWEDDDDTRDAAGALLGEAWRALGWDALAEILALHVRHRDLPNVGVLQEPPWPPPRPTDAELGAAPPALQVAWDFVQAAAPDEDSASAQARARRLGLDWDDPVARAVAVHTADEAAVARLLGG
ncbi:MAG: hypothetical protein R3F59_29210 [Myxococcota bacterium]